MLWPARGLHNPIISVHIAPTTVFMSLWKVAGSFCIPKAITVYCGKWSGVTNEDIGDDRGVGGTCRCPFSKSSLVIKVAKPILSTQSSIWGKGNESGTATAFNSTKSVQNCEEPSDFGANKQGLQGLWLFIACQCSVRYAASSFIVSLFIIGHKWACCFIGVALPTSTSWFNSVVHEGTSPNRIWYVAMNTLHLLFVFQKCQTGQYPALTGLFNIQQPGTLFNVIADFDTILIDLCHQTRHKRNWCCSCAMLGTISSLIPFSPPGVKEWCTLKSQELVPRLHLWKRNHPLKWLA